MIREGMTVKWGYAAHLLPWNHDYARYNRVSSLTRQGYLANTSYYSHKSRAARLGMVEWLGAVAEEEDTLLTV